MKKEPKIAIVADWMTNYAGAERVISAIHSLYPQAPIFTTLFNEKKMREFKNAEIITSSLQKIPWAASHHQYFLPWMPCSIEQFDLGSFDIVISSSHSVAKGVITKPETLHICYCHTPMRYAWDECHKYIREYKFSWGIKKIIPHIMTKIRLWDRLAAFRVDHFIANSKYVASRIKKYYQADAEILPPPVDTEKFRVVRNPSAHYYLAVGRLIPYKKFDLIVETFNKNKRPVYIAGAGPEEKKLKKTAKRNIKFLGFVSEEKLYNLYENCKALIFPQIEDAGIVPLEAMAAGRPVIALKKGGAKEIIKDGVTGIFFARQKAEDLLDAVERFEEKEINGAVIRQHAIKYSLGRFQKKFKRIIEREWEKYNFSESKYMK